VSAESFRELARFAGLAFERFALAGLRGFAFVFFAGFLRLRLADAMGFSSPSVFSKSDRF
jgi:hypothetical protein